MEREENPPLLNHLLQHFQSHWGFLEEPGRLRELEVCTCLGGRSHALITHRMPAAVGALLSDCLQLRSQLSCKMNELLASPQGLLTAAYEVWALIPLLRWEDWALTQSVL